MIYLGQPYSSRDPGVVQTRVLMGQGVTAALFQQGYPVYSPIAHWHETASRFKLRSDADYWYAVNVHMINLCEEFFLLALTDWQMSVGLSQEVRAAVKLLKPIKSVLIKQFLYDPASKVIHIPSIHIAPITDIPQLLRYFTNAQDHKEPGPNPINASVPGRKGLDI